MASLTTRAPRTQARVPTRCALLRSSWSASGSMRGQPQAALLVGSAALQRRATMYRALPVVGQRQSAVWCHPVSLSVATKRCYTPAGTTWAGCVSGSANGAAVSCMQPLDSDSHELQAHWRPCAVHCIYLAGKTQSLIITNGWTIHVQTNAGAQAAPILVTCPPSHRNA